MKEKKIPMRMCVGCREMKEKKSLARLVKTGEGIVFDPTGRMNGRGAYICKNVECLERAVKTKALERALEAGLPTEELARLKEALGFEK